jgi:hypothetical protein
LGCVPVDWFRLRRTPLVEKRRQDDVHAHLEELGLPVLERRLDEIAAGEVADDRHRLLGAVFALLVVIRRRAGEDHADEEHKEQPQARQQQPVVAHPTV